METVPTEGSRCSTNNAVLTALCVPPVSNDDLMESIAVRARRSLPGSTKRQRGGSIGTRGSALHQRDFAFQECPQPSTSLNDGSPTTFSWVV